jgi:hypothetical protein
MKVPKGQEPSIHVGGNIVAADSNPARADCTTDGFDPYASQRHMRGRKSHLAAAINQNIHDHPFMGVVWLIIFVVLLVGSFVLGVIGK